MLCKQFFRFVAKLRIRFANSVQVGRSFLAHKSRSAAKNPSNFPPFLNGHDSSSRLSHALANRQSAAIVVTPSPKAAAVS